MVWDEVVVDKVGNFLGKYVNQFTTPQFMQAACGWLNYLLPGLGTKLQQAYNKYHPTSSQQVYQKALSLVKQATLDAEKAQAALERANEAYDMSRYGSIAEQSIDKTAVEKNRQQAKNDVAYHNARQNLAYNAISSADAALRGEKSSEVANEEVNDIAKSLETSSNNI